MIICSMPQCQTTAGCVCGLATAPVGSAVRAFKPAVVRFGPDPRTDERRFIVAGDELGRIVRETMERMRKPLWFWEEWILPDARTRT